MPTSTRLGLPLISSGQAQKEITVNEALQAIDIAISACVEEPPRATPPANPAEGRCFIVAANASGAWAGHSDEIACLTAGGWRFCRPVEGQSAYVRSTGVFALFRQSAWEIGTLTGNKLVFGGQQVVGPRGTVIAGPAGGSVVDVQCRGVVEAILGALRTHGLIAV